MFETHKLNGYGFQEMKEYKETMAKAVSKVVSMMPDCRERSLFITTVEESVFWGAKAIAQKEQNHDEVYKY